MADDVIFNKETLSSWSFSGLQNYERCNYFSYLKSICKHPEEQSEAASRGTELHTIVEEFIKGERDSLEGLPDESSVFHEHFERLRELYKIERCIAEEDWGFTTRWEPTGWTAPDTWLRAKLDQLWFHDPNREVATVEDLKSGKMHHVKHMQQAQLYAILAFIKYPELQFVNTRMLYLDSGNILEDTYTQPKAAVFLPRWDKRARKMTNDVVFTPNPSKFNCKWCSFGSNKGTGVCDWDDYRNQG